MSKGRCKERYQLRGPVRKTATCDAWPDAGRNERVPVSSPRSIGDGRPGGASGAASAPTARAIQLHMTKVPQSPTQNEQAHTGTTRTLVARVAAGTDIPHPAALAPEPHGTPRGSGLA